MKKVKIRKFNFLKFFKFLLFLAILVLIVIYFLNVPIKNIVISGTKHLTDEEIMEVAKLDTYPSYLKTLNNKIENKIKSLSLVKSVKVSKKWNYKVKIKIKEYKVLFNLRSTGEYVLDNGKTLMDVSYLDNVPVLINYVPDEILDKMTDRFSRLKDSIIIKVSEIEYAPTNYDTERFLLYMSDGNIVYITLNKIEELNNYTKIKKQLGTNKGILYLDSGNYFEIKE